MEEKDFEEVWGITQDELDELRHQAQEKLKATRHTWRQKGVWLICQSCEQQHGINIGVNKIMIGEEDDGTPILVNRDGAKRRTTQTQKQASLSPPCLSGERSTNRKLVCNKKARKHHD